MILLDGKKTAAEIRAELASRTERFFSRFGRRPALAVVLIGDDPASEIYVRGKVKGCEEAGIRSLVYRLPADAAQAEAEALLKALAREEGVDGILLQLPLPQGLDETALLKLIPCEKDVDGFSRENIGSLARGEEALTACTPLGIMELLRRYRIPVRGKRAVVIGRSNVVGRPLALLLLNADATVTVCHSRTENLKEECLRADLLIAAAGRAGLVTADMVKEGAVVIDVGINRGEGGKLCGDVDFGPVKEKASYLTPVPGGVGPMTIAMLLSNTCAAAERRMK